MVTMTSSILASQQDPHGQPDSDGGGGSTVLEREEQLQNVDPGDHERFSHYVRKEKIMESAMSGDPVVALCGKVWTPGRDPERFPVCPECKEIYQGLRSPKDGEGDSSGSGKGRGWFGKGRK